MANFPGAQKDKYSLKLTKENDIYKITRYVTRAYIYLTVETDNIGGQPKDFINPIIFAYMEHLKYGLDKMGWPFSFYGINIEFEPQVVLSNPYDALTISDDCHDFFELLTVELEKSKHRIKKLISIL